eukprot:scaffold12204_cov61-Phaeocystis_antarctica.AAC.12
MGTAALAACTRGCAAVVAQPSGERRGAALAEATEHEPLRRHTAWPGLGVRVGFGLGSDLGLELGLGLRVDPNLPRGCRAARAAAPPSPRVPTALRPPPNLWPPPPPPSLRELAPPRAALRWHLLGPPPPAPRKAQWPPRAAAAPRGCHLGTISRSASARARPRRAATRPRRTKPRAPHLRAPRLAAAVRCAGAAAGEVCCCGARPTRHPRIRPRRPCRPRRRGRRATRARTCSARQAHTARLAHRVPLPTRRWCAPAAEATRAVARVRAAATAVVVPRAPRARAVRRAPATLPHQATRSAHQPHSAPGRRRWSADHRRLAGSAAPVASPRPPPFRPTGTRRVAAPAPSSPPHARRDGAARRRRRARRRRAARAARRRARPAARHMGAPGCSERRGVGGFGQAPQRHRSLPSALKLYNSGAPLAAFLEWWRSSPGCDPI